MVLPLPSLPPSNPFVPKAKRWLNPTNEYSPMSHIVSGGVAGAAAAALTTPLDVAKTVLQTRGESQDACVQTIIGFPLPR